MWWRDLRKVCGESMQSSWFNKNIEWKIRIVNIGRFWEDTWCTIVPLKKILRLCVISDDKEKTIC